MNSSVLSVKDGSDYQNDINFYHLLFMKILITFHKIFRYTPITIGKWEATSMFPFFRSIIQNFGPQSICSMWRAMSGNKWWVPVRSKRRDVCMRKFGWCFCFEGFTIKTRKIILMRSVNFLFELTNDNFGQPWGKNNAWFQRKRYYIHLDQNRKTIRQHLSICNLELCSS